MKLDLRKNKMKKILVTTGIIVGSASIALASPVQKKLDAIFNDIKIVVDGKPVKLDKNTEPFIVDGVTYLPVRAVGEAIGKKVTWDGENQTVHLGEVAGETKYLTETIEPHVMSGTTIYRLNEPEKLKIAGLEYNSGVVLGKYSPKVQFNVNSLYSSLEFDYGPSGSSTSDTDNEITIYLDDKLHDTIYVNAHSDIKKYSLPLKGVNQVRFESNNSSYYAFFAMGDPILK